MLWSWNERNYTLLSWSSMNASVDTATLLTYTLCFSIVCLSFPTTSPGLVDALRCLQWLLWLACLSVLDYHSLDSVGQELISRERHEHSHPSRGGHSRHLIPGHGCRLRVSNTDKLCTPFMPPHFLPSFIVIYHFWPSSLPCDSQFQCFFLSHLSKTFHLLFVSVFTPLWGYLHALDTLITHSHIIVPVPFSSLYAVLSFFFR